MTIIELMAKDQKLDIMVEPVVAAGDVKSTKIHVEFSPEWSGYAKTAVFFTSNDVENVIEQVMTDNTCKVPHEVIETANNLFIGVRGVIASTGAVKTSTLVKYKIEEGAPCGTGTTVPPTADVYQQLLSKTNDLDKRLSNLIAAKIEDGEVKDIRYGADGKTYPTAGDAVREQFKNATEKQEANSAAIEGFLYPVTENIAIAKLTSGTCWDTGYYSEIGTVLPEEIPAAFPPGDINSCFTWSTSIKKGDIFGLHPAAMATMEAILPAQCLLVTNKLRVVVDSIPMYSLIEGGVKYTANEDGFLYLSGKYDSTLPIGYQFFWVKKYRDMSEIPSSGGVSQEEFEEEIGKLSREIADLKGGEIPDYWKAHLSEKIEAIKNLHKQYGRDCFSFVHIADMHYPSNLGKNSPMLAKKITDDCSIKYILIGGDLQTRGCHSSKENLLAENEQILELLKPIMDKCLIQKGNHDGAYGKLDKDGGGISNSNADGSIKPPEDRETYVHNLTPQEFHEYCYRKVGMVGNVHFDESGTAYYIDDPSNNVRYIGLNTQCNDYELRADGTQKYPTMWLMRFAQSQFDFLINKALVGLEENTKVVVFGHCPTTQEIGDREVMNGVLKAFKDKTAYSGFYDGTAEGGAKYKNLAEPLPENTTDTSKWANGYRFGGSGVSEEYASQPSTISNVIPCKFGDIIRIKGVTLRDSADRVWVEGIIKSTGELGRIGMVYYNQPVIAGDVTYLEYLGCEDGVYSFKCYDGSSPNAHEISGFRFAMPTPEDASKVIVTVNEEIVDATNGYDYVEVDCDFSNAKGKFVGYFHGHNHADSVNTEKGFNIIGTRCDGHDENDRYNADGSENQNGKWHERKVGTITEQSFDVFTVTPKKIFATKIGAGNDREITLI